MGPIRITTTIGLCAAGMFAGILQASSPLELTVRPAASVAPANVRVVITVEPHQDNRLLIVEADAPKYYRSSQVQLRGDEAARTHPMLLKQLPPGVYTLTVRLRGTDGLRATATRVVEVIGGPDDIPRVHR